MNKDNLVTVYTLTDPMLAEIIRNAIHAEGLKCEIGGEHQAGITGVLKIEILVRAEDEDAARRIIQKHEPQ